MKVKEIKDLGTVMLLFGEDHSAIVRHTPKGSKDVKYHSIDKAKGSEIFDIIKSNLSPNWKDFGLKGVLLVTAQSNNAAQYPTIYVGKPALFGHCDLVAAWSNQTSDKVFKALFGPLNASEGHSTALYNDFVTLNRDDVPDWREEVVKTVFGNAEFAEEQLATRVKLAVIYGINDQKVDLVKVKRVELVNSKARVDDGTVFSKLLVAEIGEKLSDILLKKEEKD